MSRRLNTPGHVIGAAIFACLFAALAVATQPPPPPPDLDPEEYSAAQIGDGWSVAMRGGSCEIRKVDEEATA